MKNFRRCLSLRMPETLRSVQPAKKSLSMQLVLLVFLLSSAMCTDILAQVKLSRAVRSSGAANATSDSKRLRSSLGQSTIGRTSTLTEQHKIGFWYTVQQRLESGSFSALVVVPNAHAAPGETFSLPLLLQQSKNLLKSGARSFSAVLRFNATVMEPIDKSGYNCVNDTGWVRILGKIEDTARVLSITEFVAKLGSSDTSAIEIESFNFVENSQVVTLRKNGVFSLDGVCRENGEIRLIKRVLPTTLAMFPNPASGRAQVRAFLSERGDSEIRLIDQRGVTVFTIYEQFTQPGSLLIPVDLQDIPSGSYFLLLRTPNEVFSQKVIIQK